MKPFSAKTRQALKFYVYALVNPLNNKVFYVGKASANNRAFDHLKREKGESAKTKEIELIRKANMEPIVEILRHGLESEQIALEVEASIIDAFGLANLTNQMRGHGVKRGRASAETIERLYGSNPVPVSSIEDKYILFYIKESYSPDMSELEIYDCTRQFWGVSKATQQAASEYTALAVVEGVVIRAYAIQGWFPALSTMTTRNINGNGEGKAEFVGKVIPDHPLAGKVLVDDEGAPIKGVQKGFTYLPLNPKTSIA